MGTGRRWKQAAVTAVLGMVLIGGGCGSKPATTAVPVATTTTAPPDVAAEGELGKPVAAYAFPSGWKAFDAGPLVTRGEPVGVWTGTDLLFVGGLVIERYQPVVDGAAYRPSTGRWRPIASRPTPGRIFTGVWTGREMIVWGGAGIAINPSDPLSNGDAYNPATDSWRPIAANPFTFPALPPMAAWTGSRVLLWARGTSEAATPYPGALYDPAIDHWTVIPRPTLPGLLSVGDGVWTGTKWAALALGSTGRGGPAVQTLVLFDPAKMTWAATAAMPASTGPMPPHLATTGKEILLVGETAALAYDVAKNRWREIPSADLAMAPGNFQAVTLQAGKVVAHVENGQTTLDVYSSDTGQWTVAGPPPGAPPSHDVALVSTGKSVVLFGISGAGPGVNTTAPNAAWSWSP